MRLLAGAVVIFGGLAVGGTVLSVADSCFYGPLVVASPDGFKLVLPARYSDEQVAEQLRAHDEIAQRHLEPDLPPTVVQGPDGIVFIFRPSANKAQLQERLGAYYPANNLAQTIDRELARQEEVLTAIAKTGRSNVSGRRQRQYIREHHSSRRDGFRMSDGPV